MTTLTDVDNSLPLLARVKMDFFYCAIVNHPALKGTVFQSHYFLKKFLNRFSQSCKVKINVIIVYVMECLSPCNAPLSRSQDIINYDRYAVFFNINQMTFTIGRHERAVLT